MANSLRNIIGNALASLACQAGVDVKYSRVNDWVKLKAVAGQTLFQLSDQFGAVTEYRSRDYIVKACSLKLAAAVVTPQRGDTITEMIDGKQHVYEVARPDGGDQPWSYSDFGQTHIRIHTKLKVVQ